MNKSEKQKSNAERTRTCANAMSKMHITTRLLAVLGVHLYPLFLTRSAPTLTNYFILSL